ncbi:MAG: DUF2281 domain-containing protein [Bacteroidota bacterium]
MSDQAILRKMNTLPDVLKQQIVDFIDFISQKYQAKQEKTVPEYGSLKGTFLMSDDFDEPLDMFKDDLS